MRAERLDQIVKFINKHNYCTNESISLALNIPLTTLRRDLDYLNDEKRLIRVYGGAKSTVSRTVEEQKIGDKLLKNLDRKAIIAKKALNCIKNGEFVFLDAGSTTYQLAKLLTPEMNLHIYTNSIEIAKLIANVGIREIFLVPGRLKSVTSSIVGSETIEFLNDIHFDVSFIGANAIDEDFAYYTTDFEEAAFKKAVIKNTDLPFILADSSKFNSVSFIKFSNKSKLPVISEEN